MYDLIEEFDDDLDEVVALVSAMSFNEAQRALKNNPEQVIWRSPKWIK